MSSIADYGATGKLHKSVNSLVYRSRQRQGPPPVILKSFKQSRPTPQVPIRERQDYAVTGTLDSDVFIKVDSRKDHRNKKRHQIGRDWARRIAITSILTAAVFLSRAVAQASAQSVSDSTSPRNISQREPDLPFDRYDWQSWTTQDGLPQNSVSDIVQTSDGYLWLATFGGLARFDGVRFKVFDLSNTEALPSNRILSLLEDRSGNLWIGTQGGGVVRLRDGVFTSCSGQENAPAGNVWSITEDAEGVVWFGARNLVRYADGKFEPSGPDEWMSRVKQVYSLLVDREQALWVATDNGLGRFRDGQWRVFRVADGLSQRGVRFLHEDSRGLLWASTANRLHYLDGGRFVETLAQGEQPGWIFATTVDSDGNDLVGSGKGLFLQRAVRESGDDSSDRILFQRSIERSVTENVRALLEDREGNLWVGTDGLGLLRLRAPAFTSIPLPPGENITLSIQSLADDGAGGLWIHYSGKIGHLKDDEWKELSVDNDVRAIGGIWTGSDGALWIKHHHGRRFSKYQDGQFIHIAQEFDHIDSVLVDRQGTVWISWAGGLSTIRDGKIQTITVTDGLPSIGGVGLVADSQDGTIWIGGNGTLTRYRNGEFHQYNSANGLQRGRIRSILESSDGNLWIATYGGGMARLRDGKFTRYTTHEGLPDNSLGKILEDDAGNLWINANRGVFRVSLHELNGFADGRLSKINCRTFRTGEARGRDGVRTTDGRLWFPTIDGLITIEPERVATNEVPPPIVIEAIHVSDQSFDRADRLELPMDRRDLVIEYTGLSFVDPDDVTFRYRLIGYDEDWVDAGAQRQAEYKRIPPGAYEFQVQARNNDGVWSEHPATLGITVPAHFYETTWFYAFCSLGVILTGFVGVRARTRNMRTRNAALRESEALNRAILEAVPDLMFRLSRDGIHLAFHASSLEELFVPPESIVGTSVHDVLPETVARKYMACIERTFETQAMEAFEYELDFPAEERRCYEARLVPCKDLSTLALVRNVTERKRAEQEIQEKEKQLDNLLSNVGVIVLEGDPFEIYYVGGRVERILGYPKELWFEDPDGPIGFWSKHLHPDDTDKIEYCRREVELGHDHAFEYRMIAADGRIVWFYDTVTVETENGLPVKTRSVMVDITERRRVEEALLGEKQLSEDYINSLPGLFYVFDEERFIRWNRQWERVTGYGPEELGARYGTDFFEGEDRVLIEERMRKVFRDGFADAEAELVTKDGRRIPYYFTGLRQEFNGRPHLVGLGVDITDRKKVEAERRVLEAQLRQSQKMEAVGQLAGGVAHDFNNILTTILGNVELSMGKVLSELGADHSVTECMEQIEKAAQRACVLTRQLLTFSRRGVMQPEVLNLNRILADLDKMLQRLITEDITLDTVTDPNLQSVRADAGQLEQVIVNLVVNAAHAMPDGGRLTVETQNVTLDEDYTNNHAEAQPGPCVLLTVSDTGHGMDAATRERIFEPFFTTKSVDKGSGLGLATVHGIVKQSGGHIIVYSEPGCGTTFKIYLPAVESTGAVPPPKTEPDTLPRGSETVLLCEDHPPVRELIALSLRSAGYTVIAAGNGQEGLEAAQAHTGSLDLLITDVIMPDMNGRALSERLCATFPGLPTLFISGYTSDIIAHRGVLDEGVEFLEKPFTRRGLLEKVRAVLGKPQADE